MCLMVPALLRSNYLLTPVPEGVSVNMRGPEKFVP